MKQSIYCALISIMFGCSTSSKHIAAYKYSLLVDHKFNNRDNSYSPANTKLSFVTKDNYLLEAFVKSTVFGSHESAISITSGTKENLKDTSYVVYDTTAIFIKNLKNNTQYYVKAFTALAPLLIGKDTLANFNRYDYNGKPIDNLIETAQAATLRDTVLQNTAYKYFIKKSIDFTGDTVKDKDIDMVVLFFKEPIQLLTPFNIEFKNIRDFKLCLAGYIINAKQNKETISFYINNPQPLNAKEAQIVQAIINKDPSIKTSAN